MKTFWKFYHFEFFFNFFKVLKFSENFDFFFNFENFEFKKKFILKFLQFFAIL
jgi:hypothetical protein